MDTTKPLNRDEINRNCERTLSLLRSNKPEAADLMLDMLNDSILKRYGDSKQAIDVSRFSKLNSDKNYYINNQVPNKKPKLKKIKKEKNQQVTTNVTNLNEKSSDVNIQETYQKTKNSSTKLSNKMSKYNKLNNKIMKEENNVRNKTKCIEKVNISTEDYDEETTLTIKNLNKTKSNIIAQQNDSSENSNGTQESKINEIKNEEKSISKGENELFGISPTIKRAQLQQKSITKVRSHKKPPLHELSSRQRIQAVLEKGINNK